MKKCFHLGDILSITTGRLVSPRHMTGVEDILSFMLDDQLFDIELPPAAQRCRPALLEQFPQLSDIDVPELNKDNYQEWLDKQVDRYGEYLPVEQLVNTDWNS